MARRKRRSGGRTCLGPGYIYQFQGKRRWRGSKSDNWDTIAARTMCGRKVGTRTIDGSPVVVITVGRKFYAALPHSARKAP